MRIFVASSTAGLPEARAVQEILEGYAEVVIWDQEVFPISSFILEALEAAAPTFDFGIFLLTPDDLMSPGRKKTLAPRDNVILELGLFVGSLGRRRSFLLVPVTAPPVQLPSDLAGLVQARYRRDRQDANLTAALTPACQKIRRAIRQLLANAPTTVGAVQATELSPEPEVTAGPRSGIPRSLLHHHGRLSPAYTGRFLRGANSDITIIGASLKSFIGYFDSRPESEIREPVAAALERGARVTCLFLDPTSDAASRFAHDRSDHRLLDDIRRSLHRARELQAELTAGLKRAYFAIRTYQLYPPFQLKRVDSSSTTARILFYPYLPGLKRPEIPYAEIHGASNPRLFAAYSDASEHLIKNSRDFT